MPQAEVVGVLVISKLGVDQFDEDDQRLLEVLAGHASVLLRGKQNRDGMPTGTREEQAVEYAKQGGLTYNWQDNSIDGATG